MYKFKFKYEWIKPKGSLPKRRKGDKRSLRATSVKIYDGDNGDNLIAEGHTIQSINDPDIKAVARKIAMTNAISSATGLSRVKRKEIWEEYFTQMPLNTASKDEEVIEAIDLSKE